jgi:cell wall-associated NlpC family hydrolase
LSFDRFIGLPWIDKGRSFDGVDCYGLVWLVNRELRAVELPSYAEDYVTSVDRLALARLIAGELDDGGWDEIPAAQEQPFDAVLIREGRMAKHIGLVTRPGMMLHVEQGGTSQVERYRAGIFAHRVVGFYRFRAPQQARDCGPLANVAKRNQNA